MKKFNAGEYKKYRYNKDIEYNSLIPACINRQFNWEDNEIYTLLSKSDRLIGQLNSFSGLIPDIDVFILMHLTTEASKSSKIEGTQTEIDEAILPKKAIKPEKRGDWTEVQNYIKAMDFAIVELKKIPLCMRLVNETHKILLSGVRGAGQQPGHIRKKQNWIGTKDLLGKSSIRDAIFIPPHHSELPNLLSDLEKFWHNDQIKIPELIRIAISHYQFETIHPYNDGNGRIGRLLITLQLVDYGLLEKPTLYISDFFEKNKGFYYNSLSTVREANKLEPWVKFFLRAVIATAEKVSDAFKKIIELRKIYDEKIRSFGSSAQNGGKLLLEMFSTPLISTVGAAEKLGVSYPLAARLIKRFLESKIVVKYDPPGTKRKYYALWEYLNLFR